MAVTGSQAGRAGLAGGSVGEMPGAAAANPQTGNSRQWSGFPRGAYAKQPLMRQHAGGGGADSKVAVGD